MRSCWGIGCFALVVWNKSRWDGWWKYVYVKRKEISEWQESERQTAKREGIKGTKSMGLNL